MILNGLFCDSSLFNFSTRSSGSNVLTVLLFFRLGENPILSVVFFQFLQDRFKENEYSGPFIASIVEVRKMKK